MSFGIYPQINEKEEHRIELYKDLSRDIILSNPKWDFFIDSKGIYTRLLYVDVNDDTWVKWNEIIPYMQNTINKRISWFKFTQQCSSNSIAFQKRKNGEDLSIDDVFKTISLLQSTTHGVVVDHITKPIYQAVLISECNYLPICVQIENMYRTTYDSHRDIDDRECVERSNMLLMNKWSNNYPFVLDQWVVHHEDLITKKPICTIFTLLEYVNGNVETLLNQIQNERTIFNIYCQILFSAVQMSNCFDIIHGNLYLQHILYNIMEKPSFQTYTFEKFDIQSRLISDQWVSYTLEFPTPILIKVPYYNTCHQEQGNIVFTHFSQLKNIHVMDLQIPKYAKDILSITYPFYEFTKNHPTHLGQQLHSWFFKILSTMNKIIMKTPIFFTQTAHLNAFIQQAFSASFMGKELQTLVQLKEKLESTP